MTNFIPTKPAKPITDALGDAILAVMEAKKKIGEYSNGTTVARVYKLSGEHDEGDPYHVKLFKNGKHHEPADYFTNDEEDAHGTAKHMVKESVNENYGGPVYGSKEYQELKKNHPNKKEKTTTINGKLHYRHPKFGGWIQGDTGRELRGTAGMES